ncbi:MAG TPA: hypothetical protein GX019_07225 [Firmicutes bacterium]|jgi:hypothetical protein|nr:hypothetical protein [Bacillota bacterium]
MKSRQYIPIIVLAVLALLVGANSFFAKPPDSDAPRFFQSQAGGAGSSPADVVKFELDIELMDGDEIEMDYSKDRDGRPRAEIVRRNGEKLSGDEAAAEIETLISSLPPLTSREPLTLVQGVLDQLQIAQDDLEEFELKYRMTAGFSNKIELEIDDFDDTMNDD